MMADQEAPFHSLSSDNRGPLITLVSVSLLIIAVIFVLAKFGSAIYFKQRRMAANTPIWVASVIAIIQVALLQKAVDNGLGKHQDRLSEGDVRALSKFAYTAHILGIIVMSLSKMSTMLLIWKLTPSSSLRRYCTITTGIVGVWAIFAILVLALQCDISEPWIYSPEQCSGKGALFYPIAVMNVLTEIILVILPFLMMRNVQMAWHKQVKILSSFSSRICVVGLAIAQLALIPSFIHSPDTSWSIVDYEIISQAMVLTSITIACVPTLYHIFAGLHSGLTTFEIPHGAGLELSRPKASGYINHSSTSGHGSTSRSRGRSRDNSGPELFNPPAADAAITTQVSSGFHRNSQRGRPGQGRRGSSESEGAESTRQLTRELGGKEGVMRTVDITVEVDHRDEQRVGE